MGIKTTTLRLALAVSLLCMPVYVQTTQASVVQGNASPSISIILTIDSTRYTKNGETLTLDVPPYISQDNRTMVPIRFIAEGLGAKVTWDDAQKTDYIELNGYIIKCVVGESLGFEMGTPIIKNDRLFVPVRYIAEVLGAVVNWNAGERQVIISMKPDDGRAAAEYPHQFIVNSQNDSWSCGGANPYSDLSLDSLNNGFMFELTNQSANGLNLFALTGYNGDFGSVSDFMLYGNSIMFSYNMRITNVGDFLIELRKRANEEYGKVINKDTPEQRISQQRVLRVYINGELTGGYLNATGGNGHSDFYLRFDRLYKPEDIKTIRLEAGYSI